MISFPDALLPPEARSATLPASVGSVTLLPSEAQAMAAAVPRRRLEFARGRATARAALFALGRPVESIPVGPHREPVWPAGVVGSISHCEALACAAVAPADRIEAIGIDVEPARALPPEVRERVLSRVEADLLRAAAGIDTVGFGAKECIHKAVHPKTGVWLDFGDVHLAPDSADPSALTLTVAPSVPDPARALLKRLRLRWSIQDGLVFTAAWARAVAPLPTHRAQG